MYYLAYLQLDILMFIFQFDFGTCIGWMIIMEKYHN